jgi:NADPH2:quinone reductase
MLIPLLFGMGRAHHGEILSKLAQIVDEGKVRPLLDSKIFSMTEIASAHQQAESGQAIGKVVLTQSFNL